MSSARAFEVRELSSRGHGAVGVVAVTGPGALARVRELCARRDLAVGDVRLVTVRARDAVLDQALCVVPSANEVELHLHGNPLLVAGVVAELGGESGELERSLETRAWSALSHAATDSAARILLDQAEGALRRELEALVRDDDAERLAALVARSHAARFALSPARVVLAGPVNAGKSTLFNRLVGERRAIESAEPGTTRDVLRERARFGAYPVELFDVAGARAVVGVEPSHELELAGQRLARELCARADWVLWLSPSGAPPPAELVTRATAFLSRADEASPALAASARGSLSARDAPEAAAQAVHAAFRERFELPEEPWTPGAGAAFDSDLRDALEAAQSASGAAGAAARRAVWQRVLDAH